MRRKQRPLTTIYEVYNTSNDDVHTGTYTALAERLQRAAGKPITRRERQTEHAHLHRCTQAAYPLALRITIKATQKESANND